MSRINTFLKFLSAHIKNFFGFATFSGAVRRQYRNPMLYDEKPQLGDYVNPDKPDNVLFEEKKQRHDKVMLEVLSEDAEDKLKIEQEFTARKRANYVYNDDDSEMDSL